jgi:hypothetical protein
VSGRWLAFWRTVCKRGGGTVPILVIVGTVGLAHSRRSILRALQPWECSPFGEEIMLPIDKLRLEFTFAASRKLPACRDLSELKKPGPVLIDINASVQISAFFCGKQVGNIITRMVRSASMKTLFLMSMVLAFAASIPGVAHAQPEPECQTDDGSWYLCSSPVLQGQHLHKLPGCTGPWTQGKVVWFGNNRFVCSGRQTSYP